MKTLSHILEVAKKTLRTDHNVGAGLSPIPSRLDIYVSKLINLFITSRLDTRLLISSAFSDDHSFVFLGYAERMAALAVRKISKKYLYLGLAAVALENARFDIRENMLVLATLLHSAQKIGVNPQLYFEKAAHLATNKELVEVIQSYPNREDRDHILESMRYEEITAPDGFRYKRKKID